MIDRHRPRLRALAAATCTLAVTLLPVTVAARTYDIVYVRQPRYGNTTNTTWPEVAHPANRNGFVPPRGLTNPTLQLFVMDEDGANVTASAPMNIGSALHPTPLVDGRLAYSTLESQGLRDGRMWGIWSIWPDGRHWQPVVSAFRSGQAFHFLTQLSNGDLVYETPQRPADASLPSPSMLPAVRS